VPTEFRGQQALFGAPYGAEWRGQQPGDPRQSAQWEVPASRWAMVANDDRREGFFLLAESKYGFSARDGVLGVSLLKSAKTTVTTAFPSTFRQGASRQDFSDLGRHTIRLALGCLMEHSAREHHPAALAETAFIKPLQTTSSIDSKERFAFPRIEGLSSVIPAWAAPVDAKRWILRLHETQGRSGKINLIFETGWKARVLQSAFPKNECKSGPSTATILVKPFAVLNVEFSRE